MASPPLSDDVLRQAVEAKQQAGSELGAAKLLGMHRSTMQHRLREAARRGIAPGHFHHDQLKDHPGCTVETHRTLAANDAWHRHQGYRSGRDMKAIIYHRDHGEISRIRCGLSMLDQARKEVAA